MQYLPQVIVVLLLILINGFFAASEYAIVSVRKTRVDELAKKGDLLARLLQKALDKREEYISAIQLGTTMVSLIVGWVGEPVLADIITGFFFFLPDSTANIVVHSISVTGSFFILTFFSIMIGELVPKNIAIQRAEIISVMTIAPLTFFMNVFKPFVLFLNKSSNLILKLLRLEPPVNTRVIYSKDELKLILNQIAQNKFASGKDKIDKEELKILENVLKLTEKQIRLMITPRSAVYSIDGNLTIEQAYKSLDQRYSRFPVYKDTEDNIIGFIHVKDIYRLAKSRMKKKKLYKSEILRKVINVPEAKMANEVLIDMRKKHVHLAAVYDEFGVMVGIVTLEDVIESLIGDIQDEFDEPISFIQRQIDGSYIVDGNTPLEIIQKRFRFPVKGQAYTTIGGMVFGLLGREPHQGDKISIGHLLFSIDSIRGKQIKKLTLTLQNTG